MEIAHCRGRLWRRSLWFGICLALFPWTAHAACTVAGFGDNSTGQTTVPSGLGVVKQLAVGDAFTLALKVDGTVAAWGSDATGAVTATNGLTSVQAVAVGHAHALVAFQDGTVKVYGDTSFANASVPFSLSQVTSVSAGLSCSFAIKQDNSISAWGDNIAVPDIDLANNQQNFKAVAARGKNVFGLRKDGTVAAFCGNASCAPPAGLSNVIQIAATETARIALKDNGSVVAWGTGSAAVVPVGLQDVVWIAASADVVMAGKSDGTVVAWGNTASVTGMTTAVSAAKDVWVGGLGSNFGLLYTCAAGCGDTGPFGCCQNDMLQICDDAGQLSYSFCNTNTCGWNYSNANACDASGLGFPELGLRKDCAPTGCLPNCTGSVCGDDGCGGSCGTCPSGQFCNGGKCLGNCSSLNNDCRTCICNIDNTCCTSAWDTHCDNMCVGSGCDSVCGSATCTPQCSGKACGSDGCGGACGTCGVNETCDTGTFQCVFNGGGDIGDAGGGVDDTLSDASSSDAGSSGTVATCGVYGYGSNSSGETTIPADIGQVVQLASASYFSVALRSDGTSKAWGAVPTDLQTALASGIPGVKAIAAGDQHVVFAMSDGTVKAYGLGAGGGATIVPSGLTGVVAVAAGYSSSFALKSDGSVVAWGTSSDGLGAVEAANGATGFTIIGAHNGMAAGIKSDGSVVAFTSDPGYFAPSGLQAQALAFDASSMYALKSDGTVAAWGSSGGLPVMPVNWTNIVAISGGNAGLAGITPDGTLKGLDSVLNGAAPTGVSMFAVGWQFLIAAQCPASCGAIGPTGCCDGDNVKTCDSSGAVSSSACATGSCGWSASGYACNTTGQSAANNVPPRKCPAACTPNCTGKNCGSDGCGGSCGDCAQTQACGSDGMCKCVPSCNGKTCGSDGCGGSCGLCPGGTSCDATTQQCKCTPKCDGKSCGPDGCGGTCGTCATGASCGTNNQCQNICVPSCAGKTCGSDGCGGSCGFCAASDGLFCSSTFGECRDTGCPNVPLFGCCDGETAKYCAAGHVEVTKDCHAAGLYCGWAYNPDPFHPVLATSAAYMCQKGPGSVDKYGTPRACPGSATCVPNCTGKGCGSDGCGGSCGTCAGTKKCEFSTGQCKDSACANVPYEGCCKDGTVVSCNQSNGAITFTTCKPLNTTGGEACLWNGSSFQCMSPNVGLSKPNGIAGICPASVCMPNCKGKNCGSDGCGGSCGTCKGNDTCNAALGYCQGPCVPVCNKPDITSYGGTYHYCGYDDGCGGTCGCKDGQFCNVYGYGSIKPGYCQAGTDTCKTAGVTTANCCINDSQLKSCNGGQVQSQNCKYGCGWSPYSNAYYCLYDAPGPGDVLTDPSGAHPLACPGSIACVPLCKDKQCGSDGCGGTCGSCADGQKCDGDGKCMDKCAHNVGFEGCCNGDQLKMCGKTSSYDAADKIGLTQCAPGTCGWKSADGKYGCNSSGSADPSGKHVKACECVPSCLPYYQTCGSDGCGGSCGSCPTGKVCHSYDYYGIPKQECCSPSCSGKVCGDDGCGGSCGSCGTGTACDGSTGKCETIPPPPTCQNTKWQGACNGEVLQYCTGTQIVTQNCGSSLHCGWNAGLGAYSCGTAGGADPSGQFPKEAAGTKALCIPNCTGRECGSDGCGGACGSYQCKEDYYICNSKAGKCEVDYDGEWWWSKHPLPACPDGQVINKVTGGCKSDNGGACGANSVHTGKLCGKQDSGWTCQCDPDCTTRGDCCSDYYASCPAVALGTTACGDKSCDASQGETCADCPADCGTCASFSGTSPPWRSPLNEILTLPGTAAQKEQTVASGPESLLPADSPWPRAGLQAYLPRDGVLYGSPYNFAAAGSTGTFSSVAGAQGQAIRFGNAGMTGPSDGTARIKLWSALPAIDSAANKTLGGLTLAMWVRVPTSAPATVNPLASLKDMGMSAYQNDKPICLATRPGDTTLKITCPSEYPTITPTIGSVYAWYGPTSTPPNAGTVKCDALDKAGLSPTCSDPGILAAVEKACLGNSTCTVTLTPPACATGTSIAFVRAMCTYGSSIVGPSIAVDSSANGSKLMFVQDPSVPLQSTTSIKDGLWHHVAVTLRPLTPGGRRGMTQLYVDGELQGSSDALLFGHFDEVVLGAGSLLGTGATPAVTKTSGVGDLDEVFVYNRALSDAEVRALKNKRDFGFLRQWPATSAEQVVTTRLGIASGTPSVTAVTNPAVALQEGASKPLTASWAGLTVQNGNYAQLQADSDLAAMSSYTLMGWIRADNVAAGGTLLQLTKGTTAQAALTLTSDCDGLGVKGTVGSNSTPVSSCEHGLRANTWQFVALVQNGPTLQAYIDGALAGTLTATTTPTILSGTGNVGLQTGTGVTLGWSALANRAMPVAELEQWRNPGPAVWMDGFHYVDGAKGRMRDYANFANFSSKTTQDVVEVFDNKGASWQPTAGGTALTLSSSNSTSSEVRIAARGRLRASGANGLRPFAFTGRVTFGPGSVANVPLVSNATGDGQTSWTPRMNTTLKCTRSTDALSCNFAGSSQLSDGTWKLWTTETRSAAVGNVTVHVDVAVSFDGTDMHFALSSPDATFGAGSVGAAGPGGGTPVGYVLTTTPATGTALPKETATAVPNGAYFRMTPPASFTGTTAPAFALARLYPRPLSNTELGQQVLRACTDQHCSDINRSCVDGGQSLPVCGNCKAGSFEVSGTHGGQCYVRKNYGGNCAVDAECVSGFCQNGSCGAKELTTDCTAFCHGKGRECVMAFTGYSFKTAMCANACLPYYTQPGLDHFDPDVDCIWSPDADVGEVCAANDECKSGSCSSVSDYVYNFTVDRSPACKADGTCPGWQNTSDNNKPFKCDKRWDMDLDLAKQSVCMWVPTGNTQISTVQRCDATSAQACADVHRKAVLANKSGINGTPMYKCGDCDPTTWTNSLDGKTYPLWVKRWRLLSPEACQLMHTNLVRAFVAGKYTEIPGFLFESFNASTLGQFILEKPPGSILTPAEFAKLITKGVGPEMIDYVLDSDVRATWDAKYPALLLADCAMDPAQPKAAPFNNKNDNYQVCAPNQFPDGSPCPPDGVDASLADSFCQSGFCARDTHKCEEGYGILEDTQSASRNDHKASEDASVPPVQFVQQNTPTLQFKKVKKSTIANTAMQERNYSMSLTNSNTLSFFGTSMDVMSISNTLSGVMNGPDEAVKFNSSVSMFGISVAMPGEPPLKCAGMSWKDGTLVEPPPPHAACDRAKPSDISVGFPSLHVCSPSPGECHDDPANSPFNTVQKAKGPLCIKRFVFVGPVPVSIEVSLVIEACLGYGTEVDPDSLEGSFAITPEINVAVEAKGGVGGEVGPVELFAGVKAAITILNLTFPIKWATTVTQLQDDQNKDVENLYKLGYARSISAVLNTLKLSLSAFAEAAVSVVSVEWEFSLFEYEGLTFEWELTPPDEIFAKKVDLQHKTANQ